MPPALPQSVPSASAIHIATYQQMVDAGMNALSIAHRLVENDLALYPGITQENEDATAPPMVIRPAQSSA